MSVTIAPERAVAAVREVLRNKGRPEIEVHEGSELATLELDSLDVAEALVILEDETGAELEPPPSLVTVGDLARSSSAGVERAL